MAYICTMEDIAKELLQSIKYIPEWERQSKWYLEYLDRVNQDLKTLNNKKL